MIMIKSRPLLQRCDFINIFFSFQIGEKRVGGGVTDLDFFIGDEALAATNYAVKVNYLPF